VESDVEAVGKYVRGDLFPRTVFLFNNTSLDEGGVLHEDYLKNCQSLLANGKLADLDDHDVVPYMNIVWTRMVKEGRYQAWLARKRSNAYQAMQNAFQSELFASCVTTCSHVCLFDSLLSCRCLCEPASAAYQLLACLCCTAGMCTECDNLGMDLPSIEIFL